MKIGLVTPYVYPLPGGVNQHVRHLYLNLRLRGHDVRIITSSHGLQRASEGDVIRIGARATWVRGNDNAVIIVPNSEFVVGRVLNWTAIEQRARYLAMKTAASRPG